jgi:flagellar hook assembly protein FlgD
VIPTGFELSYAYPNPFNPSTEIVYSVRESGMVDLVVYDILGRRISMLASGYHEPNRYRVVWNGTDEKGFKVPAGVYFYRMSTETFSDVKKFILLK